MGRHAPNARLAALLAEARWNAGELARAVNALGTAHSLALRYDRTSVAHWLAGSRPRAPVPGLVATAFSARTRRLITAQDTGLVPPSGPRSSSPNTGPEEADPVLQLVALTRGDTDPADRALLIRSAHALPAPGLLEWPLLSAAAPPAAHRRANAADAQRLHEMTQVFVDLAERHGGAHARSALAGYLADDVGFLLTAGAPDPVHRDLLTAGAQLTHVLAAMTADSGHPGLAHRYYRTALGLAHAGGSRSTYAITLRAMSAQELRTGRPRAALQLLDVAVRAAGPSAPPATLAFLLVQRALAHAHERLPHAALADLAAAETQHGRASGPPGPFTAYPRVGLDFQRAQVLLALGRSAQALSVLRDSAAHRSPGQRRAFALTQARLAEALLGLGHLEEACVHWHTFLDHCPHLNSVQVQQALTRLRAVLRPYQRHRHAAAVLEHARLLTVLPAEG